jgi:hypothetical protein
MHWPGRHAGGGRLHKIRTLAGLYSRNGHCYDRGNDERKNRSPFHA